MKDIWNRRIALDNVHLEWNDLNRFYRKKAKEAVALQEEGETAESSKKLSSLLEEINAQCSELHNWVYETCKEQIEKGNSVAVLGGDHSCPLVLINALTEKHGDVGILQIDAHADLREAYEGFDYSHASIFYNVLKLDKIEQLVQVEEMSRRKR